LTRPCHRAFIGIVLLNQEETPMARRQTISAEVRRLDEDATRKKNWKRWGPYLSERQWGTVREDYSADGNCWDYFPHDHARSRAYRWGEDGLLGICDRECRLCFAVALWNGRDPLLKERLFGLTNAEGNHGEDVKECYFYLDSTPTHSYMKALYKYPQAEFPYLRLVDESRRRSRKDPEFELLDTGIFDGSRYFDILAEYAKGSPNDILIRITAANRGPETAVLHLLPTLWFRNTWVWGCRHEGCWSKPSIKRLNSSTLQTRHATLERFRLTIGPGPDGRPPPILLTENETNAQRLYGLLNSSPFVKDSFGEYVIAGRADAVKRDGFATKAAAHYTLELPAGGEAVIRLRLVAENEARGTTMLGRAFDRIFQTRLAEADEFYAGVIRARSPEATNVSRQAYAGLLWSKQFYEYVVKDWLAGDPNMPPPPEARRHGRNADWTHLFNRDVLSMPDKWEYPWYAAWDLAFHMIPFARIDPEFAKSQLVLFLREWYMHPNGQIPAYEFALGDVNPPVHAWACWRVYKMTAPRGRRDRLFLERVFQKLMLSFTWWVNRKDVGGRHIFSGGFLGLDNIGVFDRSRPLPDGRMIQQADGTAWVAFFCGTMLSMAIELAAEDPAYEDVASKFFEHFVAIADAVNCLDGTGLWDEEDGFYYDHVKCHERSFPMKIRSLVGLLPLAAVEVLDGDVIDRLPAFKKRMNWFLENRKDLARHISYLDVRKHGRAHTHHLLAIPSRERLERVLRYLLDEKEFLSPFGIRSLSQVYREHPYVLQLDGVEHQVSYVPGESDSDLFGGNSNWRGPVWFPVNFLLIEALERYHHFYAESLKVQCPSGSGRLLDLQEVADELRRRLTSIFLCKEAGHRPCHEAGGPFADDPHWKDLVLFHEYFHGDTGRGLGAEHQTGWTALVTEFIRDAAKEARRV
jgi:hypothetical protein